MARLRAQDADGAAELVELDSPPGRVRLRSPVAGVGLGRRHHAIIGGGARNHECATAMSVSEEYARRLALREAEVARLAKLHDRIGNGRLALGSWSCSLPGRVLFQRAFSPAWLLVPVAAFVVLVLYHSSVRRAGCAPSAP